jgi:hypothetical protein
MALTFESGHSGGTGQQLGQSYEVYGGGQSDDPFAGYESTPAQQAALAEAVAQYNQDQRNEDSVAAQVLANTQQAVEVKRLQQLQRDLRDIERRQAQGLPFGVPAYFNFAKQAGLNSLVGQMLGGGELSPADLAARQSQVIRDPLGRAVGFTSPSGSLLAGTDPYAPQREAVADMYRDDRPEVVGSITEDGKEKCPTGYMFDKNLQACRLDTGMADTPVDDRNDGTAAYARMGLLDVAPDFSGSAFGDGLLFDERNKMFRLRSATRPDIFRTRPSTIGMKRIA